MELFSLGRPLHRGRHPQAALPSPAGGLTRGSAFDARPHDGPKTVLGQTGGWDVVMWCELCRAAGGGPLLV